jgi:hypothetical protein
MVEVHVVLSYDLGLKGDYNGLYIWLDQMEAIECGNNLAAFAIDVPQTNFETVYNIVKDQISAHIAISSTDRIYMLMKDSNDNQMKGKFLFGNRKRAPWEGYFQKQPNGADLF